MASPFDSEEAWWTHAQPAPDQATGILQNQEQMDVGQSRELGNSELESKRNVGDIVGEAPTNALKMYWKGSEEARAGEQHQTAQQEAKQRMELAKSQEGRAQSEEERQAGRYKHEEEDAPLRHTALQQGVDLTAANLADVNRRAAWDTAKNAKTGKSNYETTQDLGLSEHEMAIKAHAASMAAARSQAAWSDYQLTTGKLDRAEADYAKALVGTETLPPEQREAQAQALAAKFKVDPAKAKGIAAQAHSDYQSHLAQAHAAQELTDKGLHQDEIDSANNLTKQINDLDIALTAAHAKPGETQSGYEKAGVVQGDDVLGKAQGWLATNTAYETPAQAAITDHVSKSVEAVQPGLSASIRTGNKADGLKTATTAAIEALEQKVKLLRDSNPTLASSTKMRALDDRLAQLREHQKALSPDKELDVFGGAGRYDPDGTPNPMEVPGQGRQPRARPVAAPTPAPAPTSREIDLAPYRRRAQ